jgi:pyruvate/2-oxoglutarate dehydrogenase complex dihydrolipoamide dehydrogenase (E3) component
VTASYDLVIVGGGAAGSEAAFSVADSGRTRILLAEAMHFGGTCTNHGCVPTKALVRAAKIAHLADDAPRFGFRGFAGEVEWRRAVGRAYQIRDHMLRYGSTPFVENGVEVRFPCRAVLVGDHRVRLEEEDGSKSAEVEAGAVILAAGLEAAVPPVPGLRECGYLDNESVLGLPELPNRLAVIGSGPIGSEFAQIFSRFGVQVTVVEMADRMLPPEEPEGGRAIQDAFEAEGIEVRTGVRMSHVERGPNGSRRILFESAASIEADEVLVATGRSLDGAALGLDAAGVEWTPRGVKVDKMLRTSSEWVWAAGDVVGQQLFTHVASEMGHVAARNALGRSAPAEEVDLRIVPRVTFTDPEVASVGLTEQQARDAGHAVRIGFARLADAEKAEIDGQVFGHVKVVADAASGLVLGCQVVAESAGDMIHEAAVMMAGGVPVSVGARMMHAYPTLSELMRSAFSEASAAS